MGKEKQSERDKWAEQHKVDKTPMPKMTEEERRRQNELHKDIIQEIRY